jgi:signal peptidase I
MTQQDVATWAPSAQPRKRRAGRTVFWVLVGLALAVLATSVTVPVVTIQPYLEQSTSMQPTLAPGDQMLAVQGSSGIRRGDIVVLRVPASVSGTDDLFVKRVIALPGDHVACCNAEGQVTVDGKALSENYLSPGDRPSRTRFSATVRKGEIWVMGDHRSISVDSRKWGQVPLRGVVGRVILVVHGSSFATVRTPLTFVAKGLAPMDTRLGLYTRLAITAAASLVLLLLLAIFGITRFAIRRRRRTRGAPSAGPGAPGPPAVSGPLVQPLYGVYRVPLDDSEAKPRPAETPPKLPSPREAEKPPPAETPEKPPPVETAEEAPPPAETPEKPPPAETAEEAPPAETAEEPPPAKTPEEKPPPAKTPEKPPPAKTPEEAPPPVETPEEAPAPAAAAGKARPPAK